MPRLLKIFLPILFVVLASGMSFLMVQARPQAKQKAVEPPVLLVSVQEARREAVTFMVSSQGSVQPRTKTTLVSEVTGQIVEVSPAFVSGGLFKKGDVLIRIDSRKYKTSLKRAHASVARARTSVTKEKALADYAYTDWKRLQHLDATKRPASDLTLRKPQLQEAQADLASAQAVFEEALEDLNRTVIRAPYDGMVTDKLADVGQYVNTGSQVARTFAIDYAEVRLPLTQRGLHFLDLNAINAGHSLPVILTAQVGGEDTDWPALVVRSEGVFDPTSRVLYVVAQIDDPYDLSGTGKPRLRVGTFVTASIRGREGGDLFVVPRHALQRGKILWILDAESRIWPRDVNIVRSDEFNVYVDEGLENGDRFTITPIDQPLAGMKVRFDG